MPVSSLSPPRQRDDEPEDAVLELPSAPPLAPRRRARRPSADSRLHALGEAVLSLSPTLPRRLAAPTPGSRRDRLAAPLRSGRAGIAGLALCGVAISLSAGGTDLLLPRSARPVPDYLAGPLGNPGINLGLAGLIVVFALMFASYAVAVRHSGQLTARTVLICIGALHALVLLAPPLLSTDIFSYGAYGRMGALYGINPYLYGPSAIVLDPIFPFVGSQWVTVPTAYSPLFTALSYALAPLSIAASVVAYKGIAAISSLATVVVVWKAARLRGLDPVKAVALVGLNPVIVIYGVGGGHNDLLMLALVVGAVYVLLRRRERAGGALLVASAAIKLTGGLVLPFALAEGGRRGDRRALLAGAGVAAALVGALAFALFGTAPLHLPSTLQRVQSHTGLQSIPGFISVGLGFGDLGGAAQAVLTAVCGAAIVLLLRRVWVGRLDWITGAGWATFVVLVTAGSLLPWYMAWMVPLAALSRDRRLFTAAIVMTGLGMTTL